MNTSKGTRVKRSYSKEFKDNAVRLAVQRKKPVVQIAQELGIQYTMICRWKKEQLETLQKNSVSDLLQLQKELDDTRKELATVQKQCDKYREALNVLTVREVAEQ